MSLKDAETERLARERRKRGTGQGLAQRLDALATECAALPDVDLRTAEDIVGYDEHGVPR